VKNIPVDKITGRVNYSKIQRDEVMPNLLAVQLDSYNEFLQTGVKPDDRTMKGIETVFQTIFPIDSTRGNLTMEYMSYKTGEPKYGTEECQERGLTYSVPLKVRLRLVVKEEAEGSSDEDLMIRDIQEQEVYLGELPMITEKGTFLINGAERVIVSQLHRSPGVFFSDEIHPNGRRLFRSRIIPYRGSWVEFTTDINNILYVHIDRKRKQPATMLLRALGFQSNEDFLRTEQGVGFESLPIVRRDRPIVRWHDPENHLAGVDCPSAKQHSLLRSSTLRLQPIEHRSAATLCKRLSANSGCLPLPN